MNAKEDVLKSEESLLIVPVPALVAVLMHHENEKGAPLTEEEVLSIRDSVDSIAIPLSAKQKLEETRGYADIDPENVWAEWQITRRETYDLE